MDSLGGLPVKVEHVPQPCAYTHPIGHVHLVQRISTLGIEGREDRGVVTRDPAQQMNAGAI